MDSKLEKRHRSGQPKASKRKHNLDGLRKIYLALRNYPHAHLDHAILSELQIKVYAPLEEPTHHFFVPFDSRTFDELWTKAESFSQSDPEYDCEWPAFWLSTNFAHASHLADFIMGFGGRYPDDKTLLAHGPWGGRRSDGTVLESCLSLLGEHDCVISRIHDNTKHLTPHLGCTIIDGAEMDEGLLWSEVLSAVSLMARRLLKKEFDLNELAPVFIITLAGKKARILQADFDTRLFIQKSDIIDLSKENYDGIKDLLRWMMCQPTGL